jgi:nucleoside-diphosphate-sugar epimerase
MLDRMRICVTGATGFIGNHVCRHLASHGHEVSAIDLWKPDVGMPLHRFTHGDIRDPAAMRTAMQGCEAVLSLAAAHHDFGISEATYFDVNERGSRVILEEMDRQGIRRVCWYSSCAVYGDTPAPRDESAVPKPNNFYGASKLAGEHVFRAWAGLGGGRSALVIRPTITFGPGNVANMYSLIRQIASGRFFVAGNPTNFKSLSYVENLVEATMHLWPRHGEGFDLFNFVEKPDLTSVEIAETIASALGRASAGPRLPLWLVLLMAKPFDLVTALTGKDLGISSMRVRKLFVWETRFEAEKLRQAGFTSPVPVREGLSRMVKWWSSAGKEQKPVWRQPPAEIRRFSA